MKRKSGLNNSIDLLQEFLPVETESIFQIHRFSIYQMTPATLFPNKGVQYFTMLDKESADIALLGIKWVVSGNILEVATRMHVGRGDDEIFEFVAKELVFRLSQQKMDELKNENIHQRR